MLFVVINFDIQWENSRSYKKIYDSFVLEASKGRPEHQIIFEASTCLMYTPESGEGLIRRIVSNSLLRVDKDRLFVVDLRAKSVFTWGCYNKKLHENFKVVEII